MLIESEVKQNIYDNISFFERYLELRETRKGYNEAIEEPAMWEAMPSVEGATVLDIGCGFGGYCAKFVKVGASEVIGIDVSSKMLNRAQMINSNDRITYLNLAVEDFDFVPEKFDAVISSLTLHYVSNYAEVVKRVYVCLKASGNFIFSVEHPICTCREKQQWITDEAMNHRYWLVDQYSFEGQRSTDWFVNGVIKYHRTVETYVMTLIREGFEILHLAEPIASDTFIRQNPELKLHSNRPPILLIKARKK